MGLAELFNTDSFTVATLTASINAQPYVPGRLGKLGIFSEEGLPTTTALIESIGTSLSILPSKPRGAPPTSINPDKRSTIPLAIPHFPAYDALLADEVQGVREFGTPDQLRTVEAARDRKLLKMSRTLDLTLEYHRIGAIQGIVLDADGSTLLNAFSAFGISQPADIAIPFSTPYNSVTAGAPIRAALTNAKRAIRDFLGGDEPTGYWVACSDGFFDALVNHGEIRTTYLNQVAAADLRTLSTAGETVDTFSYAGFMFENYRGKGAVAIPAGKAQIVPLGIPDLFITRYAPAPYFSAVNTVGLPRYALATLDPTGEKRIDLEAQINDLNICTRPGCLARLVAA